MNRLRHVTHLLFSKYLLVTNTAAAGSLLALGDALTQHVERIDKPHKTYDFHRTCRLFSLGFIFGPASHYWYKILDLYLPGATVKIAIQKILCDQTVAAPFFCSVFFMGTSILEGKSTKEGIQEVKDKFLTVYLADWCVWPPAQFINFFFLPTNLRVVYVMFVTLIWNTFLSWMKHKELGLPGHVD